MDDDDDPLRDETLDPPDGKRIADPAGGVCTVPIPAAGR
jgi:hypothetical protein